jgi:hypothetical protein
MSTKQKYHHLRKVETYERYMRQMANRPADAECDLCRKARTPLVEYKHWVIVENDFPYDRIALVHDMLITKRHVSEAQLSEEELADFRDIKQSLTDGKYQHVLESLPRTLSIPDHHHVHLVRWNSEE